MVAGAGARRDAGRAVSRRVRPWARHFGQRHPVHTSALQRGGAAGIPASAQPALGGPAAQILSGARISEGSGAPGRLAVVAAEHSVRTIVHDEFADAGVSSGTI